MRISEALGKPIVSAETGEKVGQVDDVLLDVDQHQVTGLLMTDGFLSKQRVLPIADVQTVGQDAVIVRTDTTIVEAGQWLSAGRPAKRSRDLHGKDVITSEGTRLGTVHDIVAEAQSGRMTSLELASSKRAGRGRYHSVAVVPEVRLTGDVVVVPHIGVDENGPENVTNVQVPPD